MYEVIHISRKTWRENRVELIVFNGTYWLNEMKSM